MNDGIVHAASPHKGRFFHASSVSASSSSRSGSSPSPIMGNQSAHAVATTAFSESHTPMGLRHVAGIHDAGHRETFASAQISKHKDTTRQNSPILISSNSHTLTHAPANSEPANKNDRTYGFGNKSWRRSDGFVMCSDGRWRSEQSLKRKQEQNRKLQARVSQLTYELGKLAGASDKTQAGFDWCIVSI